MAFHLTVDSVLLAVVAMLLAGPTPAHALPVCVCVCTVCSLNSHSLNASPMPSPLPYTEEWYNMTKNNYFDYRLYHRCEWPTKYGHDDNMRKDYDE